MLQNAFQDEACAELFSDARLLAAMARFEGALAGASAAASIVSAADAKIIAQVCAGAKFDAVALARDARRAGTLTIPFVKSLTGQVAAVSPEAARWVHFGATSQDVIDTAVVLCLGDAAARIVTLSKHVGDAAAALASAHRATPTVARTLLQPAVPVPFGWKAAVWLSLVGNCHAAFIRAARESQVLQFGGAGGTLAAYGTRGDALATSLATALGLQAPAITWHSARDGFARLGSETALLAGAAGKIARDVSLLMQPEVGEAFEQFVGRVESDLGADLLEQFERCPVDELIRQFADVGNVFKPPPHEPLDRGNGVDRVGGGGFQGLKTNLPTLAWHEAHHRGQNHPPLIVGQALGHTVSNRRHQ